MEIETKEVEAAATTEVKDAKTVTGLKWQVPGLPPEEEEE